MIFSFVIHALMGFLGTVHFNFSAKGIGLVILISCATQGSDLIRLYMVKKARLQGIHHKKETYANPEKKLKKSKKDWEKEAAAGKPKEKSLDEQIADMAVEYKKEAPKLFARNVCLFSAVTLFTAEFSRYMSIGMGAF